MNFTLLHLTECPSTNTLAKKMALRALSDSSGSLEGTILIADRQTAGRGRIGHSFSSPEGGLYFSLILCPSSLTYDTTLITTLTAVAMTKAIQKIAPDKDIRIKWVNDLYLQDKKICGILAESLVLGEKNAIVVGVGVNVSTPSEAFPEELRNQVASLWHKNTSVAQKNALLFSFLEEFDYLYHLLPDTAYLDFYRAKSYLTGKTVSFILPGETTPRVALCTGIGPKAELEVSENGLSYSLAAGITRITILSGGSYENPNDSLV